MYSDETSTERFTGLRVTDTEWDDQQRGVPEQFIQAFRYCSFPLTLFTRSVAVAEWVGFRILSFYWTRLWTMGKGGWMAITGTRDGQL